MDEWNFFIFTEYFLFLFCFFLSVLKFFILSLAYYSYLFSKYHVKLLEISCATITREDREITELLKGHVFILVSKLLQWKALKALLTFVRLMI